MSSAVFISYARADDEDFVRRLHQDLTEHGVGVWWDRKAMESRGRTFLQELRDAIEASDRVIAVIGRHAAQSSYVKAEWEHAVLFCKGVLPVLREGEFDSVPPQLAQLHCIDFRKARAYEEALSELLDKLAQPVPPLGPFRTAVPALPPHFDPRREELESIGAILLADVRRPVVVTAERQVLALQGMVGVGKSVVAAAFARSADTRRAFGDGVIWLRLRRGADLLDALQTAGLALEDDLNNYKKVEAATSCLSKRLAEKVCLIVLDDLWGMALLTPFRDALGPRCRLLFTTRDARLVADSGAVECRLAELPPEASLRLLARWCEQELQDLPPQAVDIVDECGDLPLAIAMVGAMLRGKADRWDNVLGKLRGAHLEEIAREVPNYPYPNLFRAIEVSVEALEEHVRQRYLELAVFPENYPVPERAFQTFWSGEGLGKYHTQDILHILTDRALVQPDEQRRFTLHALHFDFVREQAGDLPALHRRLLSAYRSQGGGAEWQDIEDDGYIHNHLTWHLETAGLSEDIHALLAAETEEGQCAWWLARERRAHTAGFLSDVAHGWKLADSALKKLDPKSDPSLSLHRQTLYALVESSLASFAGNLPCELLSAALLQDIITLPQALAYARQNADLLGRAKALVTLLAQTPENERGRALAEAISVAHQIGDPLARIQAFTMLVPHLPDSERDPLLAEALRLAKGGPKRYPDPDDYLREGALGVLAPHLPATLFPEALDVVRRIRSDDRLKQEAVAHLAPYLPEALSQELIGLARSVHNEHERVPALIACVAHLPAAKDPGVLGEATQAALKYASVSLEASECLSALAPHLPTELLSTVFEAALQIRNEKYRATALAAIAPALGDEHQRQAVAAALAFEDPETRCLALCALAPDLGEEERSRIIPGALSAARTYLEGWPRNVKEEWYDLAAAVAGLAPFLTLVELPATLMSARAMSDPEDRATVLLALHNAFPEHGVLREALEAARDIDYIGSRLRVLGAIANRQPPAQAMETWREALMAAGDVGEYFDDEEIRSVYQRLPEALFPEALQHLGVSHNTRFRHRALAELSPRLGPELLRKAIVGVRGIGDTTSRVAALTELLPYVPTAECEARAQEVLAFAKEIQDPQKRLDALAKISTYLSSREREPVCRQVLGAIRELKSVWRCEQVLTALAPALPDTLLAEAMEIAREFPASDERVRAVMALSARLDPEKQMLVLRAELGAAQGIADRDARATAFAQILDYSPESLVMEVVNAARDPKDIQLDTPSNARARESVLTKAVRRLKEPERSEVVKEAWLAAVWGNYPYDLDSSAFVQFVCGLAPHVSGELLNDALDSAREIFEPEARSRALIRLSACFAGPKVLELLDEAISTSSAIRDTTTRTVILSELAARVSPERRGELLAEARQAADVRQLVYALTSLAPHLPNADRVSALRDAIAGLPQIAEATERADALQRLIPLLPLELVREALKIAVAVPPQRCAELIKTLAARLPESERADALSAGLLAALAIYSLRDRSRMLSELIATTPQPGSSIPVWIDVLHAAAAQPRSGLLANLAGLAPLVFKVGGPPAGEAVFKAIRTVGRWWP